METKTEMQNSIITTNLTSEILTVEMVYITPKLANNYLEFNPKNRTVRPTHVKFLSNEMNSGRYVENGEAIIFNINHNLIDGQHRLLAIIKTGKSYWYPVVRGVSLTAMATLDTGKNRSASDILQLNGFKYPTLLAAFIKIIDRYITKKYKAGDSRTSSRIASLSNKQVLDYCSDNYYWIEGIVNKLSTFAKQQNPIVISITNLALILYIIGGKYPKSKHYAFVKHLSGINRENGTATNFIYTKLYNSKINREPLNFYWVLGMSLRAWNFYSDGNPAVTFFKFKIDSPLPKIKI